MNFFKTIGYNDIQSNSPRNHPEFTLECQKFRAYIRKLNFLNLIISQTTFENLGEEFELSDQLKNFSNLVKKIQ